MEYNVPGKMDEEESQPAAALSFDDAAAQDKEQELGEKEVEATDMQLENRKHDTTNDIDETDNGLSGYVESEAGADVSGVSGEEEIPPEADERRNTSPEAEEVILEQQGSAGVCQDSDGERPAESTDNELRDVSLDSRRRSSGNPEEDPDETRLFDAALNRPRFRTIASVLARASGASNDGEHTAAATAAAEQILASIEERTEHMLLLSNRIVQKLHSRVRSGARVTSGDSKPRIRFGSVPTIVFEGEQSMYGQWQLKEEEAEDAAVQAVRHIAALALSSVTAERPPQEDRGGSEGDEESSEIRANSPDHEAVGDGSREGGASRPEADEDEECLAESAGRGSRVMSAADSTGRESWCWNGTETRDPTEQPDASEPGERSGESKCRGERPEKNASQEEDLASMSDERAAKEFDLWFGADRRLAADRGASPLSTARDRTHRSTGPLMEGTVPIPYDTARRGFEPEKSLGAEAGVAAKAAAARELITLSLKQEKLWRMFGRDTHAGMQQLSLVYRRQCWPAIPLRARESPFTREPPKVYSSLRNRVANSLCSLFFLLVWVERSRSAAFGQWSLVGGGVAWSSKKARQSLHLRNLCNSHTLLWGRPRFLMACTEAFLHRCCPCYRPAVASAL